MRTRSWTMIGCAGLVCAITGVNAMAQEPVDPTNAPPATTKSLDDIYDQDQQTLAIMEAVSTSLEAVSTNLEEVARAMTQLDISEVARATTQLGISLEGISTSVEHNEPRTPISSLPYTISQSGSYYVTANLVSATDGIVIESSGVTVDLMGFSLTGDGGKEDYGIHVAGATNAALEDLLIKGGRISGFNRGLQCEYMNDSRIERLAVAGNSEDGVYLTGSYSGRCDGNTIADSTISGNGSVGVYFSGHIGQCDGNTIADCTISGNGSIGVYLRGHYGRCDGNTIANCSISGNGSIGVYLRGHSGRCSGNTVRENTISRNAYRGISLLYADGNRVEANNVWGTTGGTTYGIWTSATAGNFILKNTCVGQGANNFVLAASDTCGPIVTNSGFLASTGDASHPWANFSR